MRFASKRVILVGLLIAATASLAVAQQADQPESPSSAVIGFGEIDVSTGAGFGGFIYPHISPTVDVGVVPAGPVTLSAGGTVDAGYCLLCSAVTAGTDWAVRSYYIAVLARGMVHFTDIAEQASGSVRFDPYAGVMFGPRFYRFAIEYKPENNSARFGLNTFVTGPGLGAKLFFGEESRWFGFGELHYLFEFGFGRTQVKIEGQKYTVTSNDYRSGGLDLWLGAGLRL